MRKKAVVLAISALFAGVALCQSASDAFTGTWKLDAAKSKVAAGQPKNETVVYALVGDSVKVTIDGTNADGSALHAEWTGKYDGKDYAVTGDATTDMRAYSKAGAHTLTVVSKKGGKVINHVRIVISPDGKTRTVTVTATDAKGAKTTTTAVYDKQ